MHLLEAVEASQLACHNLALGCGRKLRTELCLQHLQWFESEISHYSDAVPVHPTHLGLAYGHQDKVCGLQVQLQFRPPLPSW